MQREDNVDDSPPGGDGGGSKDVSKPKATTRKPKSRKSRPATAPKRSTRSRSTHPVGTIVRKRFEVGEYREGEVTGYDNVKKLYNIKYLDGTVDHYDDAEMKKSYKILQKYSHEPYKACREMPTLDETGNWSLLQPPAISPEPVAHKPIPKSNDTVDAACDTTVRPPEVHTENQSPTATVTTVEVGATETKIAAETEAADSGAVVSATESDTAAEAAVDLVVAEGEKAVAADVAAKSDKVEVNLAVADSTTESDVTAEAEADLGVPEEVSAVVNVAAELDQVGLDLAVAESRKKANIPADSTENLGTTEADKSGAEAGLSSEAAADLGAVDSSTDVAPATNDKNKNVSNNQKDINEGDIITVGRLVEVASRTWPGINKPGGVARVVEVHFLPKGEDENNGNQIEQELQGSKKNPTHVNVRYVVGSSREKQVPVEYVKLAPQYEGNQSTTKDPSRNVCLPQIAAPAPAPDAGATKDDEAAADVVIESDQIELDLGAAATGSKNTRDSIGSGAQTSSRSRANIDTEFDTKPRSRSIENQTANSAETTSVVNSTSEQMKRRSSVISTSSAESRSSSKHDSSTRSSDRSSLSTQSNNNSKATLQRSHPPGTDRSQATDNIPAAAGTDGNTIGSVKSKRKTKQTAKARRRKPAPPPRAQRRGTRSSTAHDTGTIVRKRFSENDEDIYKEGEVIGYDSNKKLYEIKYLDGTLDHYDHDDMKLYYKILQKYSHESYDALRSVPKSKPRNRSSSIDDTTEPGIRSTPVDGEGNPVKGRWSWLVESDTCPVTLNKATTSSVVDSVEGDQETNSVAAADPAPFDADQATAGVTEENLATGTAATTTTRAPASTEPNSNRNQPMETTMLTIRSPCPEKSSWYWHLKTDGSPEIANQVSPSTPTTTTTVASTVATSFPTTGAEEQTLKNATMVADETKNPFSDEQLRKITTSSEEETPRKSQNNEPNADPPKMAATIQQDRHQVPSNQEKGNYDLDNNRDKLQSPTLASYTSDKHESLEHDETASIPEVRTKVARRKRKREIEKLMESFGPSERNDREMLRRNTKRRNVDDSNRYPARSTRAVAKWDGDRDISRSPAKSVSKRGKNRVSSGRSTRSPRSDTRSEYSKATEKSSSAAVSTKEKRCDAFSWDSRSSRAAVRTEKSKVAAQSSDVTTKTKDEPDVSLSSSTRQSRAAARAVGLDSRSSRVTSRLEKSRSAAQSSNAMTTSKDEHDDSLASSTRAAARLDKSRAIKSSPAKSDKKKIKRRLTRSSSSNEKGPQSKTSISAKAYKFKAKKRKGKLNDTFDNEDETSRRSTLRKKIRTKNIDHVLFASNWSPSRPSSKTKSERKRDKDEETTPSDKSTGSSKSSNSLWSTQVALGSGSRKVTRTVSSDGSSTTIDTTTVTVETRTIETRSPPPGKRQQESASKLVPEDSGVSDTTVAANKKVPKAVNTKTKGRKKQEKQEREETLKDEESEEKPIDFLSLDVLMKPTAPNQDDVYAMCRNNSWHSMLGCIQSYPEISTMVLMQRGLSFSTTTILHQAILSKGDIKIRDPIIRKILFVAPHAATLKDSSGALPLHRICQDDLTMSESIKETLIWILIDAYPEALTHEAGKTMCTPLHLACNDNTSPELLQMMVHRGEQASFMYDKDGFLPIHIACRHAKYFQNFSPEKLEILLAANPGSLFAQTGDGRTLWDLAKGTGIVPKSNYELLRFIENKMRVHGVEVPQTVETIAAEVGNPRPGNFMETKGISGEKPEPGKDDAANLLLHFANGFQNDDPRRLVWSHQ